MPLIVTDAIEDALLVFYVGEGSTGECVFDLKMAMRMTLRCQIIIDERYV